MHISDAFDGGNIICNSLESPDRIELEIRKDNGSDFYQWFYFRLTGARREECIMRIRNAGGAAYAGGWEDYQAVASYDRQTWFRVATSYRDGVLTIRHRPERDSIYYAYFAPYSMERHADLVARSAMDDRVRLTNLGSTLDGQDMDLLTIGTPHPTKPKIWIIARQHPGETMAEWLMEGLLDRLLDSADPVAGKLLDKAVFHIVPNMNPDGSRRGHLRTNAVGTNLNREWAAPSMDKSPEVFVVRGAMESLGIDFCLDVHGDETLPHNYLITPKGIPSWSKDLEATIDAYQAALLSASPDFQTEKGVPAPPAGKADLSVCSNNLAEAFGVPAMTLEQPFKDAIDRPDRIFGWSPARAKHLGRANLDALLAILPRLKAASK